VFYLSKDQIILGLISRRGQVVIVQVGMLVGRGVAVQVVARLVLITPQS
jgi:hypothetical protein